MQARNITKRYPCLTLDALNRIEEEGRQSARNHFAGSPTFGRSPIGSPFAGRFVIFGDQPIEDIKGKQIVHEVFNQGFQEVCDEEANKILWTPSCPKKHILQ